MSIRSFRVLVWVAAVSVVVLGACGGDDTAATTTTAADGPDAAAVQLVNDGVLTVCSDIPYPPFEMPDEADPTKFTGYDVEIVNRIADMNGWRAEFVVTPFDGIIGAVNAGTCDMIASAMTITEERKQNLDFSLGYFDSEQSLLVTKENAATFPDLASLAGKSIGVQTGTTGEAYANENKPEGATIVTFEKADQLFTALASGQIQAVLQDFPVNFQHTVEDDTTVVVQTFPTDEQYGFAVKKGNTALLEVLNAGITELQSSGEIDRIFKEFFPTEP